MARDAGGLLGHAFAYRDEALKPANLWLFSPRLILGLLVLVYLLQFPILAILRVVSGLSIQRLGYLSLNRISYSVSDGLRADIGSLAIRAHRPSFARPSWFSIKISGLKIWIDLEVLAKAKENGKPDEEGDPLSKGETRQKKKKQFWEKLTEAKNNVKRLHDWIHWLRLVDIELEDFHLAVTKVGAVQVANVTLAVDTRRTTVDRRRLFRHKRSPDDKQPVEWTFLLKGMMWDPEDRDSLEIVDWCSVNVHGCLYRDQAGLRDTSISFKVGRINIPYDDLLRAQKQLSPSKYRTKPSNVNHSSTELQNIAEEDVVLEKHEDDPTEFITSSLRGIKEVQFAATFVGITKEFGTSSKSDKPVYLNVAMNEIGLDLFQLDQKSPAHRMYFSRNDVAHQALIAAISVSASLDDGLGKPERVLYIPMMTTTLKTTVPSRMIAHLREDDVAAKNSNLLFANVVITSPSLDLDLKHISVIQSMLQTHEQSSSKSSKKSSGLTSNFIATKLPKTKITFSIQEPVGRVVLPALESKHDQPDDYDLLISTLSSVSLEIESSHSAEGQLHYVLTSNLRMATQELYYQSAAGLRHNLVTTSNFEVSTQLTAAPELSVTISSKVDSVAMHLVRPETSKGIYQVMQQFRRHRHPEAAADVQPTGKPVFLRQLPPWLVQVSFTGSQFLVEVGGLDTDVSDHLRGVAFQLGTFTAEYVINRETVIKRRQKTQRRLSSALSDDDVQQFARSSASIRKSVGESTDGRRLAVHLHEFEGYVIEDVDTWETKPFISIPRLETSISTASDKSNHSVHIRVHARAAYAHYSLYRYYAIGVAASVLRRAFGQHKPHAEAKKEEASETSSHPPQNSNETFAYDIKLALLQIKADMPFKPNVMLDIYGLEGGLNKWTTPFVGFKLIRFYCDAPRVHHAWARLLSLKNGRVNLRKYSKEVDGKFVDEQSIDIISDNIRLGVPHQLVLHKIFDNFVNTVKATAQLNYRYKTNTNEYILTKHPEGPKKIPRISVRTRAFLFEIEDSSFDWKLGLIYRIGLNEQKQRLAREEAWKTKSKKLNQMKREPSRPAHSKTDSEAKPERHRWRHRRHHNEATSPVGQRPRRHSSESPDTHERGRPRMRYNGEAQCDLSSEATITADEAWEQLQVHNARSWKRRIQYAMRYQATSVAEIRKMFWGDDQLAEPEDNPETILDVSPRPSLMATLISDLQINIEQPAALLENYAKFIHSVGKRMPLDTKYSLLVPLHVEMKMGETRMVLRNYPLPLLHIPALKSGQSAKLPVWSLKTPFIIGEEFRDEQSIKHVQVQIVPASKIKSPSKVSGGFAIDVLRTVSPVKTYSQLEIDINSAHATSITWGTSYQPAIQDMMQVIEAFTKPQADPSEKPGFWDKIRLSFHSRVKIAWRGGGDVHLKLKGSRDPYIITGYGAGFVMCFRNGVRWNIHATDDPKEFMTVDCDEYVLAIPDYSPEARKFEHVMNRDGDTSQLILKNRQEALFKKVIMKFSGKVRWQAGLVFERPIQGDKRSFDFKPHYEVTLKTPQHAKAPPGKKYDAFDGFRSSHIHLSIAVVAPGDRDWQSKEMQPSSSYNSVHMTPRFFTHFFDWWSQFSGVMSLPVRQGKLFPGAEKSSKKFGRHLATIKYNLFLAPVYIAHIYKHKSAEEFEDTDIKATGLKLRIESFMLDLHQRREEFNNHNPFGETTGKASKSTGMKLNEAQVDLVSADLRAVSATIKGVSVDDLAEASDVDISRFDQQAIYAPDLSRFDIPDHDARWIDMDDFIEMDWILPAEAQPETRFVPLVFAPRFTYSRETEHNGVIANDPSRTSHFGNESTHNCIIDNKLEPHIVSHELMEHRMKVLKQQIDRHKEFLSEQSLHIVRDGDEDPTLKKKHDLVQAQSEMLNKKQEMMNNLYKRHCNTFSLPNTMQEDELSCPDDEYAAFHPDEPLEGDHTDNRPSKNDAAKFNNRFTVHHAKVKWNNSLRDIVLRYVHQVSERRGFIYYMSRKAVKFIIDNVEERAQARKKARQDGDSTIPAEDAQSQNDGTEESRDEIADDMINQLLKDGKKFVEADDPQQESSASSQQADDDTSEENSDLSDNFISQNAYHLRLIAPQIQLQSEKNANSVLLLASRTMDLRIVQIMDKERISDDVSGLVQRRFAVDMDGLQFFVTDQERFARVADLYTEHPYGSKAGTIWPPWAPLEANFDFSIDLFGWARVVQETSASLRYDKYNTLRLKQNERVSKKRVSSTSDTIASDDGHMDKLVVDFPRVYAVCNSVQYYAIFVIITDLMLYSEPLEKTREDKLDKLLLMADFTNMAGAPDAIVSLQDKIRQLYDIKNHFQVHSDDLDRKGYRDRISLERDIVDLEDQLFVVMKAANKAQQKTEAGREDITGLLKWHLSSSQIVWHLMEDQTEALVEVQLRGASYDRVDKSDGSNFNVVQVQELRGYNGSSNALYPEMVGPFFEKNESESGDIMMFRVQWLAMEEVAGIPVYDEFEIKMHPLKLQIEREMGHKLVKYVFPDEPDQVKANSSTLSDLEEEDDGEFSITDSTTSINGKVDDDQTTQPGSINSRLRPTFKLSDSNGTINTKPGNHRESLRRGVFSKARSTSSTRDSGSINNSEVSLKIMKSKTDASVSTNTSKAASGGEKSRKFRLKRHTSSDSHNSNAKGNSDDINMMMKRSTNYKTLASVKLNSVVLSLSYKGAGSRNIEDVHDLVFRMPALEYQNKMWSNLDLVDRLKKDVIKVLISHTGAIISNKFSKHRPTKVQQSRLRELASSAILLPNTTNLSNRISRTADALHLSRREDFANSSRTNLSIIDEPRHKYENGKTEHDQSSSYQRTSVDSGRLHRTDTRSTNNSSYRPDSDDEDEDPNDMHNHRSTMGRTLPNRSTTDTTVKATNGHPEVNDSPSSRDSRNRKQTMLNIGKRFLEKVSDKVT